MGYDTEFFRRYAAYLEETRVRRSHDEAFAFFARHRFATRPKTVDLGCGIGEYQRYGRRLDERYVGVDRYETGVVQPYVQADYLTDDFLARLPFVPDAFVSLFSIEACFPAAERYRLYDRLFRDMPNLDCALVSGFYYASHPDAETVGETGGLVSHQTIEPLERFPSALFEERRLVLRTPSAMFGEDVVEVWKILTRR